MQVHKVQRRHLEQLDESIGEVVEVVEKKEVERRLEEEQKRIKELESAILMHKHKMPALVKQHAEGRRVSPNAADEELWKKIHPPKTR